MLGRKLALIVRDDLAQPPKAIQNVAELIDNEKVAGLFGPTRAPPSQPGTPARKDA